MNSPIPTCFERICSSNEKESPQDEAGKSFRVWHDETIVNVAITTPSTKGREPSLMQGSGDAAKNQATINPDFDSCTLRRIEQ